VLDELRKAPGVTIREHDFDTGSYAHMADFDGLTEDEVRSEFLDALDRRYHVDPSLMGEAVRSTSLAEGAARAVEEAG
jgi:hypothetical protein